MGAVLVTIGLIMPPLSLFSRTPFGASSPSFRATLFVAILTLLLPIAVIALGSLGLVGRRVPAGLAHGLALSLFASSLALSLGLWRLVAPMTNLAGRRPTIGAFEVLAGTALGIAGLAMSTGRVVGAADDDRRAPRGLTLIAALLIVGPVVLGHVRASWIFGLDDRAFVVIFVVGNFLPPLIAAWAVTRRTLGGVCVGLGYALMPLLGTILRTVPFGSDGLVRRQGLTMWAADLSSVAVAVVLVLALMAIRGTSPAALVERYRRARACSEE